MTIYLWAIILGLTVAEALMVRDIMTNKERIESLEAQQREDRKRLNNQAYLIEKTFVEMTIASDDGK